MKKILKIIEEALPVVIMIGLIPLIKSDYILTLIYIIGIIVALLIQKQRHDIPVFILGFIALTISEWFFTSTGVEVFMRRSLFGIMPLWLPLLWGYAFVAIKRSIKIVEGEHQP